mmetsp:Transcript_6102/g.20806  ORF Transcript_6102/g.20806 Transcript_6102/m.20806 type:complete len:281 (+) Transcript_6102:1225-2067(+)
MLALLQLAQAHRLLEEVGHLGLLARGHRDRRGGRDRRGHRDRGRRDRLGVLGVHERDGVELALRGHGRELLVVLGERGVEARRRGAVGPEDDLARLDAEREVLVAVGGALARRERAAGVRRAELADAVRPNVAVDREVEELGVVGVDEVVHHGEEARDALDELPNVLASRALELGVVVAVVAALERAELVERVTAPRDPRGVDEVANRQNCRGEVALAPQLAVFLGVLGPAAIRVGVVEGLERVGGRLSWQVLDLFLGEAHAFALVLHPSFPAITHDDVW